MANACMTLGNRLYLIMKDCLLGLLSVWGWDLV
jgi:hypothetical protein